MSSVFILGLFDKHNTNLGIESFKYTTNNDIECKNELSFVEHGTEANMFCHLMSNYLTAINYHSIKELEVYKENSKLAFKHAILYKKAVYEYLINNNKLSKVSIKELIDVYPLANNYIYKNNLLEILFRANKNGNGEFYCNMKKVVIKADLLAIINFINKNMEFFGGLL